MHRDFLKALVAFIYQFFILIEIVQNIIVKLKCNTPGGWWMMATTSWMKETASVSSSAKRLVSNRVCSELPSGQDMSSSDQSPPWAESKARSKARQKRGKKNVRMMKQLTRLSRPGRGGWWGVQAFSCLNVWMYDVRARTPHVDLVTLF